MAEHPEHIPAPSATPSKGLQSLPNCMKRVKVEEKYVIRHLCNSAVFDNVPKARTWLTKNPEHKPCPTLWFKDNADAGEDDEADEGEDEGDLEVDEDEVAGADEQVESKKGEKIVEEVAKDKTGTSKAKESLDEKNCKEGIDQEQEGFDADSEEADTDVEGNQKKKKLKAKKAVGGKIVKSGRTASGDETDSSRIRSNSLTWKNAPPCIKRKEKKEDNKRLTGFLHLCDSHWFPNWTEAKKWLEQNEDHLSFSTTMGSSRKEDKTHSGKKARNQKEAPATSSKKIENIPTKKKSKQPGSGVSPLAALQAAMEGEVSGSQIEASGTKSPDMFNSEEEDDQAAEGDEKEKATGQEKSKQAKKLKKNESCKAPSKDDCQESESEDSGEEMGNSKSRVIGRQLEKELENRRLAGRGGGSQEKAGDKNSNSKGDKDAEVNIVRVGNAATATAQGNKSDAVGKDAEAKAGRKTAISNEKQGESSSSDSDSETEGFSSAKEPNNSTAAKKVMKKETEESSSSGSESESESEEEESSKVTNPKSSSQAGKASINNKSPTITSPSKGGGGAAEKKESSSSESETEAKIKLAWQTNKTTKPESVPAAVPVASKKPPQGFNAPRLESFKKRGLSSPGSTATTSGPKGSCTNTSVFDSPKTVTPTKTQDSSSESSSSSDEESSGEEMKKKKVAGIKKMKKGERAPSSSSESESESDSSDNEDALTSPEGPKTSLTVSKPTEALGEKKLAQPDGSGVDSNAVKKDKNAKEMQVKEKKGVTGVKDSPEKAASPTKSLKTKENKVPVPAASKPVEQGKAVTLKSNQASANASTFPVSKAELKEKAISPNKSPNASLVKSSDVKTSPVKSPDVESRDASLVTTPVNLGNKKKADAKQSKEKGEPPQKLAKVMEKKKDLSSPSKTNGSDEQKQVEKKDDKQQTNGKSQPVQNVAKESKKTKQDSSSPFKTKGGEAEMEVEKKGALASEKKSPQLSSTLVPRNNPVEKLKIQETDCSPILRKVKDAFGSYFEKTMMDGEETVKKQEKSEGGTSEGKEENVKKKKSKKDKKQKKPEAGFL